MKLTALVLCLALMIPAAAPTETERYVALTFDDGPSGRFTRRLLDGLMERDVQVTFLLCGYRMQQYPEITARIAAEGHEIGLHGYSHGAMDAMNRAQLDREIRDCLDLMPEGCTPVFLRPPGGKSGKNVRGAAEDAGLSLLAWDVDPRDWATSNAQQVEKAVLSKVRDGDVVLLHDMSDSSVEAALVIVDTLLAQGFRLVTVSELANIRGVPIVPGRNYSRFPPV